MFFPETVKSCFGALAVKISRRYYKFQVSINLSNRSIQIFLIIMAFEVTLKSKTYFLENVYNNDIASPFASDCINQQAHKQSTSGCCWVLLVVGEKNFVTYCLQVS